MNRIVIFVSFLVLAACTNDGPHRPVLSGGDGVLAKGGGGAPGFSEVQAVFAKNCNVCHPSKQSSDWMNYETSKAGANLLMRRVVVEKSMPQKGSPQEASMTESERNLIARWIKAGAPKTAVAADAAGADSSTGPAAAKSVASGAIESCVGCHGMPPEGPTDGTIPRLASQNLEYLMNRLNIFKHSDPWDQTSPMNKIAFGLTAEHLRAAAEGYTNSATSLNAESVSLDPAQAVLFAQGRAMALENCVMCHGSTDPEAHTNDPLIPALAGQNEDYIKGQLYAYRTGARRNAIMNEFALGLTDADIDALSVYFAHVRKD